ncbi:MAG TPA: hypothetical protein VG753_02270 [Candidatus Paceibacterota bacterium]|nr:hypothetical protein [Candidatus Paceibacterota bacterium]
MIFGFLIPALRYEVFQVVPADQQGQLYLGLLLVTIFGIAWIIADFFIISNALTEVSKLRENAIVSVMLAIGLFGFMVHMYDVRAFGWWIVVPVITCVVDALITVDRAINAAALKRLLQEERDGH